MSKENPKPDERIYFRRMDQEGNTLSESTSESYLHVETIPSIRLGTGKKKGRNTDISVAWQMTMPDLVAVSSMILNRVKDEFDKLEIDEKLTILSSFYGSELDLNREFLDGLSLVTHCDCSECDKENCDSRDAEYIKVEVETPGVGSSGKDGGLAQ